jgi:hypothetical protein
LILLAALKYDYYKENAFPQPQPKFDEIKNILEKKGFATSLDKKEKKLLTFIVLSKQLKKELQIE